MKKLICLLITVVLSFSFASVGAGDTAYDAGDYETAIAEYKSALEQDATNLTALTQLAKATTVFAGTKEDAEAQALYEEGERLARQAIELDPESADAHFELARALGRLAQFRGILESINLASDVKRELELTLELDPNYDAAMHALALWHLEVPWIAGGRTGEIRPLFEQAIAIAPDAITHYVDYGDALIRLDDKEAARVQLEAALAIPATTFGEQEDHETARSLLEGL